MLLNITQYIGEPPITNTMPIVLTMGNTVPECILL